MGETEHDEGFIDGMKMETMILLYGAGGGPGRGAIPMESASSRLPDDFLSYVWGPRKIKRNCDEFLYLGGNEQSTHAMKTDMVPQNVAMKVDRPRKNSYQPTFLDAEEMQHLFKVVKGTRLELPVLVAAFYGLRRDEVLGLKWDAIDFNRGTLTIKRTVTQTKIDGKYQVIEQDSAKTKSSLRTLPLVGSFKEYFMEVKKAQELNKKGCGNCYNYDYDGYVFVDEMGDRMKPDYLTNFFPEYIQKHGMKKMRFHDLRHSCASLLLANGVPLKQIQEWLGHSDFSTTANIYAHLDYTSKISSAEAMEKGLLLPGANGFESKWMNVADADEEDD